MSENEGSESQDPNSIKAIISQIGNEVVGESETRHMRCRSVNGGILVKLIQDHNLPGIIYTIRPLEREKFVESTWTFHSVGIIKFGENSYVSYDQTSTQESKGTSPADYYFFPGTLNEISQSLGERFGFDWDLEFKTGDASKDEDLSVEGKINKVEKMITEGKTGEFSLKDITSDDPGSPPKMDDKNIKRPLGIKYQPLGFPNKDFDGWSRIRERFTWAYA